LHDRYQITVGGTDQQGFETRDLIPIDGAIRRSDQQKNQHGSLRNDLRLVVVEMLNNVRCQACIPLRFSSANGLTIGLT
jgi:hypothetical protein